MTSAFENMPCGVWKIFHFGEHLLPSSWFVCDLGETEEQGAIH
jgi:hypothetical protein